MAVLVLGGYGLIGREVVAALLSNGLDVVSVGRSIAGPARTEPRAEWRKADIGRLLKPEDWAPLLAGVDAVVNASGALQTGLRDDLDAVQDRAMRALYQAARAQGVRRIVQISAPGAQADATTPFMQTKAAADAALRQSQVDYVILRPALVIGAAAYGGTALVRALASLPWVTLLVMPDALVRTVSLRAVADAVVGAVRGDLCAGSDLILAEPQAHTLAQVVAEYRRWLGFAPAPTIRLPSLLAGIVGRGADLAGWLGWRSPLRTTAMKVMREGVAPTMAGEAPSLQDTLAATPATPQDRWFARMWLLKPLIVLFLSLFWIASGWIGLVRREAAVGVLAGSVDPMTAQVAVVAGSIVDIILGAAILFKPTARASLVGMIAVTLAYLLGSAILAPAAWLDPLGPMVKTIPLVLLFLVALAILEDR